MSEYVENFMFGGVDDDVTGFGVLATVSAAEALNVAHRELDGMGYGGEYDRPRRAVLRITGKHLYRVTTEVEDRIEGYEEIGRYKRCTPRAKSGREYWIIDILWVVAS